MDTHSPAIVLVEDDPSVAHLLERHLSRNGFRVDRVETLAAARTRLEKDWDVLVLDRHLPDGDGVAFCGEVRATAPHGYIVLLTGDTAPESKIEGFAHGADDYVTKPFELEELTARVRAGARIVALQKQLLETNRRLAHLSLTDSLTSLRNRRAFDYEFSSSFELARRHMRPLTLLAIDLDYFKRINDDFGHYEGDVVLRELGQLLASHTRKSDIVARVGGEEFVLVLPETPLFEGIQAAEKIRSAVAAAALGDQPAGAVTISIGLANMPHTLVATPARLFEAADDALYRAKNNGRNRVEIEKRREPRTAQRATFDRQQAG